VFEHEIAKIGDEGLRPLTFELIEERIELAFAVDAITDVDRAKFLHSHVFARGMERGRENQVAHGAPSEAKRPLESGRSRSWIVIGF
jgi:hypothetical protein